MQEIISRILYKMGKICICHVFLKVVEVVEMYKEMLGKSLSVYVQIADFTIE